MNKDVKMSLIKTWFKARFDKKPENDKVYFQEWVGRFAGMQIDDDYLESRHTWDLVKTTYKVLNSL